MKDSKKGKLSHGEGISFYEEEEILSRINH